MAVRTSPVIEGEVRVIIDADTAQLLATLTQATETARAASLLVAARTVTAAWVDAGPAPAIHERAKAKLRRQWPALAIALDALASLDQTNNQKGTP